MKQKLVIKLSMNDEKSRKKAFKTVVSHSGVESTSLKGAEKNQMEVVGEGIDPVMITTLLRKNVGYAELFSVSPVGDKKDGDNKGGNKNKGAVQTTQPPLIFSPYSYGYSSVPYLYEVRDPNYYDPSCTIM